MDEEKLARIRELGTKYREVVVALNGEMEEMGMLLRELSPKTKSEELDLLDSLAPFLEGMAPANLALQELIAIVAED